MTQVVVPLPQRNFVLWFLFGIFTLGIGMLIYMIVSQGDLDKFSKDVFRRTSTMVSVPSGILYLIPIVNIFIIIGRFDKLNTLLNVSGIQIPQRTMSGIMVFLINFLPIIGTIIALLQFAKWQSIMNQVSMISMQG
ncbi:MAG: hypothetical protein INQ03_22945 [Candidatus Heimdallarchaeota archaeon]|nr:hypothetical protein [Candidatus Heimdallarchaeota archaeon]